MLSSDVSVDISEIRVLPISEIIKSMGHVLIVGLADSCCSQVILLLVLPQQPPAEEGDHEHKQGIAAEMHGEGDEVGWGIPFEENLGADGVSDGPRNEVRSDHSCLLRLSRDIAGDHGQGEGLR